MNTGETVTAAAPPSAPAAPSLGCRIRRRSTALRDTVARSLADLPDDVRALVVGMYGAKGGKRGGWASTDRAAWAEALLAGESVLEARSNRAAEASAKLRDVRRALEASP